jgi:hypothetical protein
VESSSTSSSSSLFVSTTCLVGALPVYSLIEEFHKKNDSFQNVRRSPWSSSSGYSRRRCSRTTTRPHALDLKIRFLLIRLVRHPSPSIASSSEKQRHASSARSTYLDLPLPPFFDILEPADVGGLSPSVVVVLTILSDLLSQQKEQSGSILQVKPSNKFSPLLRRSLLGTLVLAFVIVV